jgi:serine phosphatase RsbU (regulator of sigma subunit)
MFPDVVHRDEEMVLRAKTLLVLYSDGITEAQNMEEAEFGMDRLVALVERDRDRSPAGLVADIIRDVDEFTLDAAQYDDQTIMVARIS